MDEYKIKVEAFCNECVWAWAVYDQYTKLFESGEERLKLLEKIATTYFTDLHIVYKGYILSQICKLTDPAKTMGNFNLTTNYLVEHLPWPSTVKEKLTALSEELNRFRNYIIPARNKILSHFDLSTTAEGTTLGSFPIGEEKKFWDNLQEFVNIAYGHLFGDIFPIESTSVGDVDELIEALKKAVNYDQYFKDKKSDMFKRKSNQTINLYSKISKSLADTIFTCCIFFIGIIACLGAFLLLLAVAAAPAIYLWEYLDFLAVSKWGKVAFALLWTFLWIISLLILNYLINPTVTRIGELSYSLAEVIKGWLKKQNLLKE